MLINKSFSFPKRDLNQENRGFSLVILLIIIFFILVIGVFIYFFQNSNKKNEKSSKEKNKNEPVVIQAGVLTTPELVPIIETRSKETIAEPSPKSYPIPSSDNISTPIGTKPSNIPVETPKNAVPKSSKILNKKVYLVIYNPKVDGRGVIERFNWGNPTSITDSVISFFRNSTQGRVNYSIVKRATYENFPIKTDSFSYTSDTYKKCMDSSNKEVDCHNPDNADYLDILKTTGACELLNRGEIDELWIWGGPYFGFWESNVAGPKGFFVNSGPTVGSTCQKMLPIMGYNYERGVNEAVHNFGHRAESVMRYVYSSWDAEPTHSWNKFSLLDKDKKGFAGCGNTHFAPNSTQDYQYNPNNTVKSNCDEFYNFPEIKGVYKDLNCNAWGCSEMGYYAYWWKNFPQNEGSSVDGYLKKEFFNNWLLYVFDFAWID